MPEGPEIRRAADNVERALINKTVEDVYFAFPHLKDYGELLKGSNVTRVDTKGKAMLIRFDNGYTIYSHNQLYGKWYIRNTYNYPKTNRQLRLALHNEKKSALLYSASDIEVLRDEEVPSHPFISKVGPDLLSEEVSIDELVGRMKDKRFRNRKWSILLLDQGFVAGIGNYLRSEIMFIAGIHPSFRPVDCTEDQLNKAAHAMMDLVKQSYETGGITNDPVLAQKLKDKGVKRSRYRHWVFNREGESCFICGSEIEKTVAASRRLYHCPVCQGSNDK
ncbi:endonuclease VIII [Rossellomorea vietnamensis]|uniref:endonuclease VIII n=1 Tax=Rossellomorea vietnamensis TaxID=218284 RepID=UPI003084B471|nr:endonuclease VIII [Rossellomorea vietnamensis]WQI97585.1 endonuclease VIII [Rossellomorea vietnamensis]WQI97597.1 endonuclease VIII [Rossellomorea vietnamensis]